MELASRVRSTVDYTTNCSIRMLMSLWQIGQYKPMLDYQKYTLFNMGTFPPNPKITCPRKHSDNFKP